MTLIDCIKFDGLPPGQDGEQAPWLIYRLHCENLVLGAQLIVNRNQEAVFFHRGNALDVFGPGAHTLSVANFPLLQRLVNLPLGVRTPISAEVYFVNKVAKLDVKWGTIEPLQITDPRYQIIVRVRVYGQFRIRISDSRNFVSQIAAALHGNQLLDYQTVSDYLRGLVVAKVKDTIADMMINRKTSIEDIMLSVDSVSIACREKVATEFDRFGIAVLSFLIASINVPDEDMAEVRKLQREKIVQQPQQVVNISNISSNIIAGGDMILTRPTISLSGAGEISSVRRCPGCNREAKKDDNFCTECGTTL